MTTTVMTASQARAHLFQIIDETAQSHKPILITSKRHNAVLISEEDWSAIQETLYLTSIPGMVESIKKEGKTPLKKCYKEIDWWPGK